MDDYHDREAMAEIYGLYSARDGKVRYVGQTGGDRTDRFKQHKEGKWWLDTRLDKWFRSEWWHGFPVKCALLQECHYDERHRMETEWIAKFPNLLNQRKLGFWGRQAANNP